MQCENCKGHMWSNSAGICQRATAGLAGSSCTHSERDQESRDLSGGGVHDTLTSKHITCFQLHDASKLFSESFLALLFSQCCCER